MSRYNASCVISSKEVLDSFNATFLRIRRRIMVMTAVEDILAYWGEERKILLRILKLLESGELKTGGIRLGDKTAEDIEDYKRRISEIDELIKNKSDEDWR